jgi:hypothetical protein
MLDKIATTTRPPTLYKLIRMKVKLTNEVIHLVLGNMNLPEQWSIRP